MIDAAETVFPMRAQGMHHDWVLLFLTLVVSWLPWALATPWVIHLARRYPAFQAPAARTLSIHAGALAAIGLVAAAWEAALNYFLDPWSQTKPMDPYMTLWLSKFCGETCGLAITRLCNIPLTGAITNMRLTTITIQHR